MRQYILRGFLLLLSATLAQLTLAYSRFTVDGINYLMTSDTEVEVSQYSSKSEYSGNITIPNKIEVEGKEYYVTAIGKRAFLACGNLQSVSIPFGIKKIGESAFASCEGLSSIVIPNSVNSIEESAFSQCKGLISVVLSDSITTIRRYCFQGCAGLTTIDIPTKVETIEEYSFSLCSNISSIHLSDSLTDIGKNAFWDCSSLKEIVIPKNITHIYSDAFNGCNALEKVTFHCKEVGSWFYNKSSIKEVIFGDEVVSIEKDAFRYCNNITTVSLPNSITDIGNGSFAWCTGLTSITLGNNVCTIGMGAFGNCEKLASIIIPSSVVSIGNAAFENCVSLTSLSIPNCDDIADNAFVGCSGIESVTLDCRNVKKWFWVNPTIKEVHFGDNVRTISDNAFYQCSGLVSLTIPISITSIGESAFDGCSSLKVIYFNASGCSVKTPFSKLSSIESIYFGDEVISIPPNLTKELELTSVSFGHSLTEIGSNAFVGAKIKNVHISDISAWCKVVFENREASPLQYAENLYLNGDLVSNVDIPNGVSSISDYAFYGFDGLSSITIPSTITSIGFEAFANCESLKQLTFNVIDCISLKSNEPFKFSSIEKVVIGNDVLRIPDYFLYYTKVKSIEIGEKVSHIGQYAFNECDSLTEVIMPNSVETIGEACFMNSGIKSIILSEALTTIPKWAFKGCNIGSIILPKNITSLGEESFVKYQYGRDETIGPGSGHTGHNSVGIVYVKNSDVVSASKAFDYTFDWWNDKYSIPCTAYVPKGSLEKYKKVWPWSAFSGLYEWNVPTDIDNAKYDEAIAKYNDGVSIYESYVYYYKGDGQSFYYTTISKQRDNDKVASDIQAEIERLTKQVSESSMSDAEKASYNSTLDEIDNAVYALKKENESGYYINFYDRVQKHYEPFSEYESRLANYKERIDAASTDEELDAIIVEIEADAASMKDYYLNPIIDDYNDMVIISERYSEIGEELSKYQLQLESVAKEIDSSVSGIEQITMSDGDVIVVNLRGERLTIKSNQIKTLPKGIYIVNGRKCVVK